ncbi:MAG: ABC transporter permease [Victivallaceae bacterium]|jgi:hypothetical protein
MKPYQALIWNEWRRMRGMFLATAGATILLYLALLGLGIMLSVRDIDTAALLISYLLPDLLALIGFVAFQGELKSRTDSFLLSLPISRGKIFWCKYLFNLSLYAVLAALSCALFFPLAMPIVGGFTIVIAIMWPAIHVMAVVNPLMQNSPGGKAGGWAFAFAFPALFIGIQAIVALYPCNELRWTGISISITSLLLWFFVLGMGHYLWGSYLALKRNVLRLLLAAAGTLIIFSTILFTAAYVYSGWNLAASKRAALAAGLELERKPAEATPEAKNDALQILDSLQQYQGRLEAVKPELPSLSGRNSNGGYTWRPVPGDMKAMRQAADFILSDSSAVKLYADLSQILDKPSCWFKMQKIPGTNLSAVEPIRNFLHDRAYALELGGHTPEAFACLDLLDKLAVAVGYRHNSMGWLTLSKLRIAVNIGPDTMEGVKYYEKLLHELASIRPEFYDDTVTWLKYTADTFTISRGPLRPFLEFGAFLLKPRYQESLVNLLRWQIAYKQLFEQAATAKYAEVYPRMLNLNKLAPLIISVSPYQIQQCYGQRGDIANMQLYLALKIYKAKYGHFPETLAQLAPEILPEIPLEPITGKNFGYHTEDNGFSLQTESFLLTSKKAEPVTYSYHTWDKTASEAETPPLPRNKRREAPAPVLTNSKEKTK